MSDKKQEEIESAQVTGRKDFRSDANDNSEVSCPPIAANFAQKQLNKKFKHASDFGINTTKKNPETLAEFQNAIENHLNDSTTVQRGTYGFVEDSKVFHNPNTNNVVILDKADNFITGFKLSPGTKQFENFINNGLLR